MSLHFRCAICSEMNPGPFCRRSGSVLDTAEAESLGGWTTRPISAKVQRSNRSTVHERNVSLLRQWRHFKGICDSMAHCLISFGSNLGDRAQRITSAAQEIADHPAILHFKASRLFETPPIGGPDGQPPFLNGVALIETTLGAREVLALLHAVEARLGRERSLRWDARTIDLDVVLYGDLLGNSTELSVPHPRYTARQFVLVPASEVAGAWIDPRFGWTITELAEHLADAVPSLAIVGGAQELRERLCRELHAKHGIRIFLDPSRGIDSAVAEPWVSSFLPSPLPRIEGNAAANDIPRLIAHLQWTTPESRWPATHQIWKSTSRWPEYRLEVDAFDWAVDELASAIDSMGCPLHAVTADGNWYVSSVT